MKKVQAIKKAPKDVIEMPTAIPVPMKLEEHESQLLRHLLIVKEQAESNAKIMVEQAAGNLANYIGRLLENRNLVRTDWAVSLSDYKTLVKLEKKVDPTPAASPTEPAKS